MQYSMELEFGMRYAEYGAVVIYVDPPSFRPQDTGPRDILTFTEQDREEQIQLIIDLRRAIDLLMARPDVDPERIAYLGVSYGGEGRYIMLDGTLVASEVTMTQQLGAGGTHQASVDHPTIGESVSGFWPNNQHEGGFEGTLARSRASATQQNWCVAR